MQCRQCGYQLWNLPQPVCPECGTGFDIRSYRFTPNTVAFACPFCGSQHAGAGPNYLPSTHDEAVCYGCQRTMPVGGMVVVPLVDHASGQFIAVPFDSGSASNIISRWLGTCVMSLIAPGKLGLGVTAHTSYLRAYIFATINRVLTAAVMFGIVSLLAWFMATMWDVLPPEARNDPALRDMDWGQFQFIMGMAIPQALIIPAVLSLVLAGPAHLMLIWTDPGSHTVRDFKQSCCAILYGQGPFILGLIPACMCQYYIAWVWSAVATVLIFRASHGISGSRAVACIVPPLVFIIVAQMGINLVVGP